MVRVNITGLRSVTVKKLTARNGKIEADLTIFFNRNVAATPVLAAFRTFANSNSTNLRVSAVSAGIC